MALIKGFTAVGVAHGTIDDVGREAMRLSGEPIDERCVEGAPHHRIPVCCRLEHKTSCLLVGDRNFNNVTEATKATNERIGKIAQPAVGGHDGDDIFWGIYTIKERQESVESLAMGFGRAPPLVDGRRAIESASSRKTITGLPVERARAAASA